ncbi:serine/threonine-protein phosphatase 2B catalytic subunit A1 [Monosporozyma unispora]|nr:calcineurin catalytic subunit A [Kazachstania unispora]
MKSDAQINTEKINNAIKIIESKDITPITSLTNYKLENGDIVKTTERLNKNVPDITNHIPTDNEIFNPDTGLPNHVFIRDHFKHEGRLTIGQALKIITMTTTLFSKEPNLLHVPAPVTVCGDIHGQYFDLLKLFEVGGDPATTPYLFLGDYVDRGSFSFECLIYLYSLKLNFPDHFWLLRGNHECRHLTSYFTFKNEILHKYNITVYDECCQSFNALPLAALMNEQYFCVHGGISPELKSIEDVNTKINRFKEIPSRGLMCDLVWADPIEEYDDDETDENLFTPNQIRGCSYAFTYKASCEFLQRTGLLSIIRAHEAQDAGYRMYKNTKTLGFPSLLTLFSAPNYLDTYKNKAAILKYENNVMNIRQFNMSPHPYWLPDFMDVFTWSLPFVGEKVTEMLVSILNICTEYELEEDTPIIEEQVGKYTSVSTTPPVIKQKSILDDEHRRKALRNKILAIAKVSRMYSVLREESDKVQYLKSMNQGILPRGALAHGSDSLNETLSTFERARKDDLINEKLPPSLDQVERDQRKHYENILKRANEKGNK